MVSDFDAKHLNLNKSKTDKTEILVQKTLKKANFLLNKQAFANFLQHSRQSIKKLFQV